MGRLDRVCFFNTKESKLAPASRVPKSESIRASPRSKRNTIPDKLIYPSFFFFFFFSRGYDSCCWFRNNTCQIYIRKNDFVRVDLTSLKSGKGARRPLRIVKRYFIAPLKWVTRPIRRNVRTNELYGRVNDSCASGFSTGFDDIIARNIATRYSTGYFCRH